MARGPLCSSPEPTHTLDHRADPLGTGARCAAMHKWLYPSVGPTLFVFFHILVNPLLIQKVYFSVWHNIRFFFTTEAP